MKGLQEPDHKKELERYNEIIRHAKRLEGLSNFKQWKEVVNRINKKIEKLKKTRDNILLGINKDVSPDRELTEVKSVAREIRALEEMRDIEKSFVKEVNEAIKEKRRLQELIEQQEKPKQKRTHTF